MGILAYNTTLGPRASQIEDLLKDIVNQHTQQYTQMQYFPIEELQLRYWSDNNSICSQASNTAA
jgi:hypothetical protein